MSELADHEYRCSRFNDTALVFRQDPLLSPTVQPLRVALKQSHASVAGRIPGELELVERHAARVDEIEVPLQEPRVVVGAAPTS